MNNFDVSYLKRRFVVVTLATDDDFVHKACVGLGIEHLLVFITRTGIYHVARVPVRNLDQVLI